MRPQCPYNHLYKETVMVSTIIRINVPTPGGVAVDRAGCPLDSDKDGIYGYHDACPETPEGAKVNARGCWVLDMVYFDTNKWNIKPYYRSKLDEVAGVMKNNPYLKMKVEGHTDSRATARYNQELSEKRADTVSVYVKSSFCRKPVLLLRKYLAGNGKCENAIVNSRI